MCRAVTRTPVFALAMCALAAAPAAAQLPGRPWSARVAVADCHPSRDLTQRYASFSGEMRPVPGTQRMAMRFTLLERLGGRRFKRVPLAELRAWRRSKPGAGEFIYTQRVTALRDGGAYRMRVVFRWYDAGGALLRRSVARSRACRQPAVLPDLRIASISSAPGDLAGRQAYEVTVANDGRGDAHDFGVALKVDGHVAASSRVGLLPPRESTVVEMEGPPCAFAVRALADPEGVVPESDESNNSLGLRCDALAQ